MVQQPEELKKIQKIYPQVDLVFGTHNLHQLPELLQRVALERTRVFEVWDTDGAIQEDLPVKRNDSYKAWVTIMYGCNNFCTYCIVPFVRGRERSRRPENILAEINGLVESGVKEVTLLGQNVNSYARDFTDTTWNFAALLRAISDQTKLKRLRFQTSHPKDLSDELIETLALGPPICSHLHLPVQSGSSRILQLMNRQYTQEYYLQLVAKLRQKIPGIALTTDIIVGFPGETEADFLETLDIVSQVQFDAAFTFIYSPRLNTPAAHLSDDCSETLKKERLSRLVALQNQISRRNLILKSH
jgi:tRNA-2-methylthio-N6-dimethylallyladenosine synthase